MRTISCNAVWPMVRDAKNATFEIVLLRKAKPQRAGMFADNLARASARDNSEKPAKGWTRRGADLQRIARPELCGMCVGVKGPPHDFCFRSLTFIPNKNHMVLNGLSNKR